MNYKLIEKTLKGSLVVVTGAEAYTLFNAIRYMLVEQPCIRIGYVPIPYLWLFEVGVLGCSPLAIKLFSKALSKKKVTSEDDLADNIIYLQKIVERKEKDVHKDK